MYDILQYTVLTVVACPTHGLEVATFTSITCIKRRLPATLKLKRAMRQSDGKASEKMAKPGT